MGGQEGPMQSENVSREVSDMWDDPCRYPGEGL